jgi:hypothetical protein
MHLAGASLDTLPLLARSSGLLKEIETSKFYHARPASAVFDSVSHAVILSQQNSRTLSHVFYIRAHRAQGSPGPRNCNIFSPLKHLSTQHVSGVTKSMEVLFCGISETIACRHTTAAG